MNTYILLFRGINVGGNNLLPMKELTATLEAQGYQQVKTYIQSGNVVLQSTEKPTECVNDKIATEFGFRPKLMILDKTSFDQAVLNNPFADNEGKAVHFFFFVDLPIVDSEKLIQLAKSSERYELIGQVFYLFAPEGIGRSKLAANVEKCLGVSVTARNLNTINRLAKMIFNM